MTGCLNGGSCVSDDKKQSLTCLCTQPWTGEKCDVIKSKKQFYITWFKEKNNEQQTNKQTKALFEL